MALITPPRRVPNASSCLYIEGKDKRKEDPS